MIKVVEGCRGEQDDSCSEGQTEMNMMNLAVDDSPLVNRKKKKGPEANQITLVSGSQSELKKTTLVLDGSEWGGGGWKQGKQNHLG
jgi:hypothetical protein